MIFAVRGTHNIGDGIERINSVEKVQKLREKAKGILIKSLLLTMIIFAITILFFI
ncbi:hypothetical protein LGQ02_16145 [Bacillus shivajii]|uniref:hypothetical protein n=1 Tax=Bacillus shivajii TaxID=1983719 RepID=UPI001CFA5E3C|nr:hypothetical protein [Bacillus shivajii]UCZ52360.1 hypothetical protein LGQ02_16145 [Bacillus shivajii]